MFLMTYLLVPRSFIISAQNLELFSTCFEVWSWVKVTENHHGTRMHGIHFGSMHPLRHLLSLFSAHVRDPNRIKWESPAACPAPLESL